MTDCAPACETSSNTGAEQHGEAHRGEGDDGDLPRPDTEGAREPGTDEDADTHSDRDLDDPPVPLTERHAEADDGRHRREERLRMSEHCGGQEPRSAGRDGALQDEEDAFAQPDDPPPYRRGGTLGGAGSEVPASAPGQRRRSGGSVPPAHHRPPIRMRHVSRPPQPRRTVRWCRDKQPPPADPGWAMPVERALATAFRPQDLGYVGGRQRLLRRRKRLGQSDDARTPARPTPATRLGRPRTSRPGTAPGPSHSRDARRRRGPDATAPGRQRCALWPSGSATHRRSRASFVDPRLLDLYQDGVTIERTPAELDHDRLSPARRQEVVERAVVDYNRTNAEGDGHQMSQTNENQATGRSRRRCDVRRRGDPVGTGPGGGRGRRAGPRPTASPPRPSSVRRSMRSGPESHWTSGSPRRNRTSTPPTPSTRCPTRARGRLVAPRRGHRAGRGRCRDRGRRGQGGQCRDRREEAAMHVIDEDRLDPLSRVKRPWKPRRTLLPVAPRIPPRRRRSPTPPRTPRAGPPRPPGRREPACCSGG